MRRNEQVKGTWLAFSAEKASQLVTRQRAQTVAEKRKGHVEIRIESASQALDERLKVSEWSGPQPILPPGILDGANLDIRQAVHP